MGDAACQPHSLPLCWDIIRWSRKWKIKIYTTDLPKHHQLKWHHLWQLIRFQAARNWQNSTGPGSSVYSEMSSPLSKPPQNKTSCLSLAIVFIFADAIVSIFILTTHWKLLHSSALHWTLQRLITSLSFCFSSLRLYSSESLLSLTLFPAAVFGKGYEILLHTQPAQHQTPGRRNKRWAGRASGTFSS